jgi:beta-mannosidase
LDGLDTFATAKFNGKEILKSDNMFVPHRVDITGHLKRDGDNVLEIDFEPALLKAR